MRCQQQLPKSIWLFSLYFLFALFQVKAQTEKMISGKVTDETGKPVPGATVRVKGGTNSTAANSIRNSDSKLLPVFAGEL